MPGLGSPGACHVDERQGLAELLKVTVKQDELNCTTLVGADKSVIVEGDEVCHDHQVLEPAGEAPVPRDHGHIGRDQQGRLNVPIYHIHSDKDELVSFEQDHLCLLVNLLVGEEDVGHDPAAHKIDPNCTTTTNTSVARRGILRPVAQHLMVNRVAYLPREVQESEALGHVGTRKNCVSHTAVLARKLQKSVGVRDGQVVDSRNKRSNLVGDVLRVEQKVNDELIGHLDCQDDCVSRKCRICSRVCC